MKALPPELRLGDALELARLLRFERRFDGGMHVKRVHAAVKSDRAKEHVRELQRVPRPFRSARDRGAGKRLPSDPLPPGAAARGVVVDRTS